MGKSASVVVTMMALVAASCTGETRTDGVRASWSLLSDTRGALTDGRCDCASCPSYPNPHACDRLEVEVQPDGSICGVCVVGGTRTRQCGGPIAGIPYECSVNVSYGQACLRCSDLYGTPVVRDCGAGLDIGYDLPADAPRPGDGTATPPAGDDQGGPETVCYPASRADGAGCEVCVDAEMRVSYDSCSVPDAPPAASTPGGDVPSEPSASATPPSSTPEAPAEPAAPATPPACAAESFAIGQELFVTALNEILVEAGLPAGYSAAAHPPRVPSGDFGVGGGACAGLDEDDLEDVREAAGDLREGRSLRCGVAVTAAAARACERTTSTCGDVGRGIVAELGEAEDVLEDMIDCVGSPIVLDLDGDGIRSARSGVRFDLSGRGHRSRTAWIVPGDALLAMDRDGDGRISDGRELFGDAIARDGFAALALLDEDHDGDVDSDDSRWNELRAWRDDGDGRSERAELLTMDAAGVTRIRVEATPAGAYDSVGSVLALWSRFERTDGTTALACDVFFALGDR